MANTDVPGQSALGRAANRPVRFGRLPYAWNTPRERQHDAKGSERGHRTYVPDDHQDRQLILAFLSALDDVGAGTRQAHPALVRANGERFKLPETMYDVLRQIAEALSSGLGVTVAPMNAMLTTREAADFLGVSPPTLVRMRPRRPAMEKSGPTARRDAASDDMTVSSSDGYVMPWSTCGRSRGGQVAPDTDDKDYEQVVAALKVDGPALTRPFVDHIRGSRHSNMNAVRPATHTGEKPRDKDDE